VAPGQVTRLQDRSSAGAAAGCKLRAAALYGRGKFKRCACDHDTSLAFAEAREGSFGFRARIVCGMVTAV
jgi:hypothetical protein